MSTNQTGRRGVETGPVEGVIVLLEDDGVDGAGGVERSIPCACCGKSDATHLLQLVVEWEEYLCEKHDVEQPTEVCRVPLCTRCRSWAEMIELAEMNLTGRTESERRKILDERTRFLDELRIEYVTNLDVNEELSRYQ